MGPPRSYPSSRTTRPRSESPIAGDDEQVSTAPASTFEVPGRDVAEAREYPQDLQPRKVSVPVLKGLSLSIERGDMVALMGSSGSGKTTLVNLLGSLDQPTSRRYWLDGIEVSSLSEKERAPAPQ